MIYMARSPDIDLWLARNLASTNFSLNCCHKEVASYASNEYKLFCELC
jgi:hypothetical protein